MTIPFPQTQNEGDFIPHFGKALWEKARPAKNIHMIEFIILSRFYRRQTARWVPR
jgi:hypothetical protein